MFDFADKHSYLSHLNSEKGMDVFKAIDGAGNIGQTLERQDLEGAMERLAILEVPFYDSLGKVKATAYDHEFNLVTSRHDKIGYAFYRDGGMPRTVEFDVTRRKITPALLGHRITITELTLATTANGVQPVESVAEQEKIVAVMEETEYALFYGNRTFGSQEPSSPTNLQFDGIINIVKKGAPQNITNLGGKPLSIAALWAAENKVYSTQGMAKPNTVFISPVDKINLQAQFYQTARTDKAERMEGMLGANATTYLSAFGESKLLVSRFLGDFHKFTNKGFGATSGDYSRPTPPVLALANTIVEQNVPTAALGDDGLDVGVGYIWAIKAANFWGESDAVITAEFTPSAAKKQARINFSVIDPSTKWFIIYVSNDGGKTFKYLRHQEFFGGGVNYIDEDGHETLGGAYGRVRYKRIPGTGVVIGVDLMTTNLAQWIPLEKAPLPQTLNRDWAIRHASALYSRAAEFNFLLVNVGQDSLI